MKNRKRRSVLCLFLAVIQVFFAFSVTAIAADETSSEGVTLSLSETTLEQDLTAEVVAEKDAMQMKDQRAFSVVAFAAEPYITNYYRLYFYVFSPGGFADVEKIKVNFVEEAEDSEDLSSDCYSKILDTSATLAKLEVSSVPYYRCGYDSSSNTLNLRIESYTVTRDDGSVTTYSAEDSTYVGTDAGASEVGGTYSLVYDMTSGVIVSSTRTDTLELRVELVSERVTSSDANTYTQINTAMMLIPNSYFEDYGNIEFVEYIYTLYDKVPMLVTTSEHLFSHLEKDEHPSVGTLELTIDGSSIYLKPVGYGDFFHFLVTSISKVEEQYNYDLTGEEILEEFYAAQQAYASASKTESFGDYISAERVVENKIDKKGIEDLIETESYDKAANWWQKLLDFRLFVENIDDSVSLSAIHVLESYDKNLSDETLAETYCIDINYMEVFRSMAAEVRDGEDGYKLLLLRYLSTDYSVYDFSVFADPDGATTLLQPIAYEEAQGYVCENAIIEDFQVLKLGFFYEDALGNVVRTVVYPDNSEQDYVGGTESEGKLEDEKTTTMSEKAENWWQQFIDKLKSIGETVRKIVIALLIAVGVWFLLRFIGALRDAFGRRYPREDKPRREKRDRRR